MRLRNTEEAADDDRRTGCGVHMPDVLGQQAGGAAKGGELVSSSVSEDLARGRRKKCPQRGLPAYSTIFNRPSHCIDCMSSPAS